jgi:ABC-type transporter Mla MlaB component
VSVLVPVGTQTIGDGGKMHKKTTTEPVSEVQTPLEVSGTCTVQEAGRIRTLLMKRLQETDRVVLNVSGVGEVDLSFLQLVCAAHKSALYANKTLVLDGVPSEPLTRKVREAGFTCREVCGPELNKDCLWAEV